MRVIMMGTGPFAVPTLTRLYESPHEVLALVTRPPRPLHGKTRAEANPMCELAVAHGTRVHDPADVNAPHARAVLASYQPELFVVCDYGQILSRSVLEIARWGGINLHASLLPKYRGAAPINWAIYHGETRTGVTVIHMTPQLDAGPAIVQRDVAIGPDETAAELEPRLAQLGAPAVLAAIDALAAGTAQSILQDPALATRAPRLKKEDGAVDWSRGAAALANQVRALVPWPKTFTYWQASGGREPLRLILDRVHVEAGTSGGGAPAEPNAAGESRGATGVSPVLPDRSQTGAAVPGTVLVASGENLLVATGEGVLAIDALQPAGKRVLSAGEFLRGYGVQPGERFGV
ncbi:MAG: methionyl-tRNA formyltransferase [Pirellulales bacterium]